MTGEFKESVKRWLIKEGYSPSEILDVKETEGYGVVCGEGTCWDSYIEVRITFVNDKGREDYELYDGEFTEFIKELTDA